MCVCVRSGSVWVPKAGCCCVRIRRESFLPVENPRIKFAPLSPNSSAGECGMEQPCLQAHCRSERCLNVRQQKPRPIGDRVSIVRPLVSEEIKGARSVLLLQSTVFRRKISQDHQQIKLLCPRWKYRVKRGSCLRQTRREMQGDNRERWYDNNACNLQPDTIRESTNTQQPCPRIYSVAVHLCRQHTTVRQHTQQYAVFT